MQKSYKKQLTIKLLWGFPLLFYAIDANAWGLYTHLFFSQWLMLSTPILGSATLSPKIQQAIKKFPKLVLAGACLPDLAVVAKAFNSTHQWHKAEQMMQNATTHEEIAITVGYSSLNRTDFRGVHLVKVKQLHLFLYQVLYNNILQLLLGECAR